MRSLQHGEVLAEAAAGLSRQLLSLLKTLGRELQPHLPKLDRKFARRLKSLGYSAQQCASLCEITPGAAARSMAGGATLASYLETVQYRGRRLAKLELSPAQVVTALQQYDRIFDSELGEDVRARVPNLEWVRGQLHFLVTLTLNSAFYQVRDAESRAFYDLFRVQAESRSLQEMLSGFLQVLLEYTGAQAANVFLLDTHGGLTAAAGVPPCAPIPTVDADKVRLRRLRKPASVILGERSGAESLVLNEEWRSRFTTFWTVPLLSQGQLQGVMQFAFSKPYHWLPRELNLLESAAERYWLAAEKARLVEDLAAREEQVRRLAEHMVEVEESERRRISRELHDEAGQSLLCIRLQLEMLEQDMVPGDDATRAKLAEVRQMTEHTILEIRRLIAALSPAILEQMGLAAALRQLVGRFRRIHDAEVRIQTPRRLDLAKRVEIIVYRLVQEILNNIAKYSMASHVNLLVDSADGCLRLQVEDDGVGFDVDEAFSRSDCFGLSGLRERVALLGGRLSVLSRKKEAVQPASAGRDRNKWEGKAGQVGIDRHGTAIWVELPLVETGGATSGPGAGSGSATRTATFRAATHGKTRAAIPGEKKTA